MNECFPSYGIFLHTKDNKKFVNLKNRGLFLKEYFLQNC